MSSFFFPHAAQSVMSAVDRGLSLSDTGLSSDFGDASTLLAENFAALEDYTAGQATVLLTGTLDGAGAAVMPHGITSAFGLLMAQAWYEGGSVGQFVPCTIDTVDENNVNVSGGTAGQPVRAFVMYSIVPPGW